MIPFEYASPTKIDDVIGLLADRWGDTEVLAGGTDLITCLKQNLTAPKRVVSLKAVTGLNKIEVSGGQAHIGATATLAEVSENADVQKHFPSLIQAIEGIGSPQILAMGTAGGDLCQRPRCWFYRQGFGLLGQNDGQSLIPGGDNRYHAIFDNKGPAYFVNPSSMAPALIALGATLTLAGSGGKTRSIKVAEFFKTPASADERENALKPNEILTKISIPANGTANATYEVRQRQGLDWPMVAASVAFGSASSAKNASVVLGHVAPTPHVASKAAAVLEGQKVTAELAAKAGMAAADGATPLSRNAYKVQLVQTAVKRAILAAAGIKEG